MFPVVIIMSIKGQYYTGALNRLGRDSGVFLEQRFVMDGVPCVAASIESANCLDVTVGTNATGDKHTCKTILMLADAGGTGMKVEHIQDGVCLTLDGVTELETLIKALQFAVGVLELQAYCATARDEQ